MLYSTAVQQHIGHTNNIVDTHQVSWCVGRDLSSIFMHFLSALQQAEGNVGKGHNALCRSADSAEDPASVPLLLAVLRG